MSLNTQILKKKLSNIVKWPGGKKWLAPLVQLLWQNSKQTRLVEPFCGGLSISLLIQPRLALLNDYNPHLMNLFYWVKQGFSAQIEMKNDKTLFYQHREQFNALIRTNTAHTLEAANLFYYLNRTGYNGLCRFNAKGEYNVPFGLHKQINYQSCFEQHQSLMQQWQFSCNDFSQIKLERDDFVYADPPYDDTFSQYHTLAFSWSDQVRLVEWLQDFNGPVVLSNQATDRIVQLYDAAGYELFFLKGRRLISCNSIRQPSKEVLAIKGLSNRFKKTLVNDSNFIQLKW